LSAPASQLLVALGVDVGSVRVERFGLSGGDGRGSTQPASSVVAEPTNVHPGVMTFRDLHDGDLPLVLPNAWDVASALAFLDAGFPAIGTTSFGVAAASGHPDGARSTRDQTRALAGLLSVLPCYVSVDIEDGYDDDPSRVAEYVASLGVDGINIEDSSGGRLVGPELHAAKVAAIKERCPELYVNARVDTYWLGEDATVPATLTRAAAYVEAGADGIFVPGAADPAELRELTSQIPVPVNVLVLPEVSLPELAEWGVRRVSTGSLRFQGRRGG
jgi:2-methylisocitrate lyase-like PEP mutase family enzyme